MSDMDELSGTEDLIKTATRNPELCPRESYADKKLLQLNRALNDVNLMHKELHRLVKHVIDSAEGLMYGVAPQIREPLQALIDSQKKPVPSACPHGKKMTEPCIECTRDPNPTSLVG